MEKRTRSAADRVAEADEIYDYKGQPATCCFDYRIARVTIHMPDGSQHALRKSDHFYNGSYIDMHGTFYAVDGSRMRYDSTGVDTELCSCPMERAMSSDIRRRI
jgi:hypothetical protein